MLAKVSILQTLANLGLPIDLGGYRRDDAYMPKRAMDYCRFCGADSCSSDLSGDCVDAWTRQYVRDLYNLTDPDEED